MNRKVNTIFSYGSICLLIASILLALASTLFNAQAVHAANSSGLANTWGIALNADKTKVDFKSSDVKSAVWIDANHILVTFQNNLTADFYPANDADNGNTELRDQRLDSKNGNGIVDYISTDIGCYAHIKMDLDERKTTINFIMTEIKTGVIDIDFKPDASYDCTDGNEPTINLQSPELSTAYFKWIDAGRIATVDGKTLGGGFTREVGTDYFIRDTEQSAANCRDKLFVDNATNKATFWELDSSYTASAPDLAHANGCKYNTKDTAFLPSNTPILIASIATKSLPAGTGNTNATSTGASEETDTCESSNFVLGWLTCGIINGLSGVVEHVFSDVLEPYLRTTPIDTTATTDNPIFKVWSSIRNIANIILIFALLFVVFGQAVGGGLIDAYTAKKIVPRLLAAAILINISIYLVAILIDIFNVLGAGIGNLILGPFKNTIYSKFNGGASGGSTVTVGVILGGLVVGILAYLRLSAFKTGNATSGVPGLTGGKAALATVQPFMHFMLVFVLLPAVLITLAIFATLIIRQGIILILVVTAPIAFAFFAIPSTEKYFKKWWDTLISTLMVYPIMTVIFSAAIILSALSYNIGSTVEVTFSSVIGALVSFVILIIPLALIPFSFKLAGGIIGNLMNTSKGLLSRASHGAQGKYKENRSLERKALFDNKMADPNSRANRRISAITTGKRVNAARRQKFMAGMRNKNSATLASTITDPADTASNYAQTQATNDGLNSGQAALAGQAAKDAHISLSGAGGYAPDSINAGALAAGAVAARGGNSSAQLIASQVGAEVYGGAIVSGVNHYAASAAANVATSSLLAGHTQSSAISAGRAASRAYTNAMNTPGGNIVTANAASESVGLAAGHVHNETARRNGGDDGLASIEAEQAATAVEVIYEDTRGSTGGDLELSQTAALAAGDAWIGTTLTGTGRNAVLLNSAAASVSAHQASMGTPGTTNEQARAAGRRAGQAHW